MPSERAIRFSADELATMAARARTLDERLGDPGARTEAGSPWAPLPSADPLALWSRAFARGDREALRQRLEWDGLTEEQVRRALTRPAGSDQRGTPSWTQELADALGRFCMDAEELAGRISPPELPLPEDGSPPCFAELWIPLVRCARQRITELAPGWNDLLLPTARTELERHLLGQLAAFSGLAVYHRFERLRAQVTGSAGPPPDPAHRQGREIYDAFIATMLGGDLAPFLVEHSVLARHLWLLMSTWVESAEELLRRLAEDVPAIEETFARGLAPGLVTHCRPGLSDRHHRGRQVLALTFASGLELVYKPRAVDLEAAFADLLEWLRGAGLDPAPRAVRTLARPGYGWFELVAQAPARSLEEVRAYHGRAGALLCLTWVLGGSDLHMDNVVADSTGPVLVDLETLLQPRPRSAAPRGGPATAIERAADQLKGSFLSSGLLTFVQLDPTGRVYDIGGLCGRGGHLVATARRTFRHCNRDGMHPDFEPAHAAPEKNLLLWNGQVQPPDDFPDELAIGFATAYRLLLEHRRELLDPGGPLARFAGARTRLVLRPSNRYAVLQYVLAAPSYQRDGLVRSFLIDALNAGLRTRPTLWPLARDERHALERLDLPYFSVPVDRTELVTESGAVVADHLERSGLDCARDRIHALSEEDLGRQLDLLRSALVPSAGSSTVQVDTADFEPPAAPSEPLAAGLLERAAVAIADEVIERAIRGDDGSATWIAPAFLRREERPDHGVSYYLYSGACGIALFLAAAARITARSRLTELAGAACQPIDFVLSSPDRDRLLASEGIGACNGLGGIVYALTWIGELLGQGSFAELAERVAHLVTPERIAADTRLDVEGGAAGAIFGLLALHRRCGEDWVLERAVACGRHLVARQVPVPSGGAAWPGPEGLMLAGFAHGAAGISAALASLHRATGDNELLATARAGFRSERAVYSPDERNWPALRRGAGGETERIPMKAWCHGAPGVALARVSALDAMGDDEELRAELATALHTTLGAGLGGLDHLCCGNLGRVDVVLESGRVLGEEGLVQSAAGQAAMVLERAANEGRFRLRRTAAEDRCFDPGFFRGLSGIGYQLLRVAHPHLLPSVLAFQAPPGGSRW